MPRTRKPFWSARTRAGIHALERHGVEPPVVLGARHRQRLPRRLEEHVERRALAVREAPDAAALEHAVQARAEPLGERVRAARRLPGGDDVEAGDPRRRRQRRRVVRALVRDAAEPVVEGVAGDVEDPHHLGPAADRRARHAPADDLRVGREVGRDAVALLGAAGRPAEAGDDLVEDEERPVALRHLAEAGQEPRPEREPRPRAAARLEDDRGDVAPLAEDPVDLVEVVGRASSPSRAGSPARARSTAARRRAARSPSRARRPSRGSGPRSGGSSAVPCGRARPGRPACRTRCPSS